MSHRGPASLLFFGLVLFCFDIDDRIGNSSQRFVCVLFFLQRGFQEFDRLLLTELFKLSSCMPTVGNKERKQ